jgi:hypothetical protein
VAASGAALDLGKTFLCSIHSLCTLKRLLAIYSFVFQFDFCDATLFANGSRPKGILWLGACG